MAAGGLKGREGGVGGKQVAHMAGEAERADLRPAKPLQAALSRARQAKLPHWRGFRAKEALPHWRLWGLCCNWGSVSTSRRFSLRCFRRLAPQPHVLKSRPRLPCGRGGMAIQKRETPALFAAGEKPAFFFFFAQMFSLPKEKIGGGGSSTSLLVCHSSRLVY